MAKLLAVDLDGTLFYPKRIKKCIPKKNVLFLRRWIDAGNKVVLVTSRSSQFTGRLKEEIQRPVDFITCCSSQIIANDKVIYENWMPNEELAQILKKIEINYEPIAFLMTTENHSCIIKYNR
ncbi:MAG: HAD hydrolase family protein, partial [Erysipelotrichaceae bacterium]|nr:HAD hydrolase family protein [Erysipelotrichaceae bacterium]